MVIIAAFAIGLFVCAWAALIVQSLADGGSRTPFFASELDFSGVPDNDDDVRLLADFQFVDSNGFTWIAPRGMESDGASVGALLRWPLLSDMVSRLIKGTPLTGPLRPAAIAHDGIYAEATDTHFWPALYSSHRAAADRVIYEAAQTQFYKLASGKVYARKPLAKWRAFVVMALLRIFGWKAWIDDSRASRTIAATVIPFPQQKGNS